MAKEQEVVRPLKKGDAVYFHAFTSGYPRKTGVVVSVGKCKNPAWGAKITIKPDEPISGYDGDIWRPSIILRDIEGCVLKSSVPV